MHAALRFLAEDFAAFPRLPIVLGAVLALAAYASMQGPVLVGPAFSLGLLAGMAWRSYVDDLPWL